MTSYDFDKSTFECYYEDDAQESILPTGQLVNEIVIDLDDAFPEDNSFVTLVPPEEEINAIEFDNFDDGSENVYAVEDTADSSWQAEAAIEDEEPGCSYETKPSHGDLINKLLSEDISFAQVASLWGDEQDSDQEETLSDHLEVGFSVNQNIVDFEKELQEQQWFQLKKNKVGIPKRRRRLPAALQGLMGEANLRYARCEYDEAIKMCMEVIRQYPHSPEPYQTLGMIYEEKKMKSKSLQYLLIAAFLSPNAEEWEKLAEISLSEGDIHQAIFCWGRAIRANPEKLDYHWARCDLLEHLGDKNKALKGYTHMLKFLQIDQGEEGMKLAKEIAKIHFENQDISQAKEAMETAFTKYPSYVTIEDVNLMLEVLLQLQEYLSAIQVLLTYTGFSLKAKDCKSMASIPLEKQLSQATECCFTDEFPLELKAKLAVALIHLSVPQLAGSLVADIASSSVEDYGDLHLEIAEGYMAVKEYPPALPLLSLLTSTEQFGGPGVWLKYGECLAATDDLVAAAQAYRQVVKLVPEHADARLQLSSILRMLDRQEEALSILNQERDSVPLDSQVLFERSKMLWEQGNIDEFIYVSTLMLNRHFVDIKNKEEAEILINCKKLSSKLESLKELRRTSGYKGPVASSYTGTEPPVEEQWKIFQQVINCLHERKQFVELERLAVSALGSRDFMKDKDRMKEIEFLCLLACVMNSSLNFAYSIARDMVLRSPSNHRCWNLFNYIIIKRLDLRHSRFLIRLSHKWMNSPILSILNGHSCFFSRTHKYALAEYMKAYQREPHNPIILLMIALTFTHMACQKFCSKKHSVVLQACAFLSMYLELRGKCQESYYNLGRAMHQLNLLPQAIHYYQKALEMPPVCNEEPILDLTKEIAFNLSLIYKNSECFDLAKYYIAKYITV